MPLLSLLAGAAQGNRDASNRNVDLHNAEVVSNRERQDKLWLQKANQEYEEYKHQRGIEREDQKYERERGDKISDKEAEREFLLQKDEASHGRKLSLENMRESGRNSRSAARNAILEKKASEGKSKEAGGAKISDLRNLRNDASSRVDEINKLIHDPMNANMDESRRNALMSDLDRAERARGDLTLQINKALKQSQAAPNLQGLLNKTQ